MEREFGSAIVHFGESTEGYLVCHAENQHGIKVWVASRTTSTCFATALGHVIMDDNSYGEGTYGISVSDEESAIRHLQGVERDARITRNEDEGLCRCGHPMFGSDHCPLCGAEEYEGDYENITFYHDSPAGRAACGCPHHEAITSTDDPAAWEHRQGYRS